MLRQRGCLCTGRRGLEFFQLRAAQHLLQIDRDLRAAGGFWQTLRRIEWDFSFMGHLEEKLRYEINDLSKRK